MVELEWLLIDSGTKNVKSAWLVETFGGNFLLRCQKMAGCLPNFLLLGSVHACGWVALLVVPDRLDFDKD